MYHQEDAGLNIEMAKLAFAKGIWSYICKMDSALRKYSTISNNQSSSAANAITLIKKVRSFMYIVIYYLYTCITWLSSEAFSGRA